MTTLKTYQTEYRQMGKHRKRCRFCGKLIADGEQVVAEQRQSEKYYPVKGIMKFATWYFSHIECVEQNH